MQLIRRFLVFPLPMRTYGVICDATGFIAYFPPFIAAEIKKMAKNRFMSTLLVLTPKVEGN
jgi:hypothetical protein